MDWHKTDTGLIIEETGREWVIGRLHIRPSVLPLRIQSSSKLASLHEVYREKIAAHIYWGLEPSPQPSHLTVLPQLPRVYTTEAESQRPKERDGAISALNAAIEALNPAKELSSITLAKAVFASVGVILTMIRVSFFYC